ncbi:ATP synthase F1 subunit epsilon [Rubrobacter taiwanensis]|uniref:ATP synthase epsilon chain n=1 Tax=Rubrobacter taiwanensis TaxID=185139 RepID=A0A4R1BPA0_9ACTN|nr:ATP synthase F1 subunit epsilon [Rubrobacter taiwanensis]TCJ19424.1 ATP synthase F1 subunit epsilon [Rubrobacter taiwanensis]
MADGGRTLFCRVITPERTVFDGEVDRVVATIADGEIGVLPDHAPLIATTKIGTVRIKRDEEYLVFATSDGFFKVSENLAQVLVEEAVPAGEIDVDEAGNRVEEANRELEGLTVEDEEGYRKRRAEIERRVRMGENLVHVARKYGEA